MSVMKKFWQSQDSILKVDSVQFLVPCNFHDADLMFHLEEDASQSKGTP